MATGRKHSDGDSLIAVVSNADVSAWIKAYCEENEIADPHITLTDTAIGDAPSIVNGGAGIVIVQGGEADDAEILKLEQLCSYVSDAGSFIVILDNPTTDAVRRLFRAGVTDVLPTPVAKNELIAAIQTAQNKTGRHDGADSGKIITLVKTAGGVGATTAAVNLARELIHGGVERVAVVDLDVQFGGVGLALDLEPRMNITDAIRAGDRLDPTLLRSVMTRHKSGFDVLPGPANLTPLNVIDTHFIEVFFRTLKASYDIVIVELPMVWRQWITAVADGTDILAPVVETTVRSADGARRITQALNDLSTTSLSLFVIANRVEKSPTTRDRMKNLGNILGAAPEAVIRMDAKVAAECADIGKCFRDVAATSAVTQDVAGAAQKIITRLSIPSVEGESEGRKGLRIGNFSILGGKS